MKILLIYDKQGTALWRLATSIYRNLPQHNIKMLAVHPKRSSFETLVEAKELMEWADIVHIHYWKSGQLLRTTFPVEFNSKPRILVHHNPYDVVNDENQYYDKVCVTNVELQTKVPASYLIPHAIDLSFFKFNENYTEDKTVMMSVARIEDKKGVLEVAKACNELGYKFILVGRISKPDYMREVMIAGGDMLEFHENVTDDELLAMYYKSAIHVCNSVDNFESGTLPILEAMACGIPVLTRMIGHVPETYNGSNMVVRKTGPEDVEDIKKNLKEMMENRDWRLKIRESAWDTVKKRDDRKMALQVNKLYYELYQKNLELISIIIPTRDNPEAFVESLVGAMKQDYPKLEIVIADSGNTPVKQIVDEAKKHSIVPIKYIYFKNKDNYTIAEARNRAVIEADGKILVFCDDRIRMDSHAISSFGAYSEPRTWLWGIKDSAIKGFVENFSCVQRDDLIKGGMFCERMQWYGGTTQEIRERFEKGRGFNFMIVDEAKAESIKRSKSKNSRRDAIIEAKFTIYKMYEK